VRAVDGDGHCALLVLVRALDVVDGRCALLALVRALDGDGPVFSTRIGVQVRGATESNGTSKHKNKR